MDVQTKTRLAIIALLVCIPTIALAANDTSNVSPPSYMESGATDPSLMSGVPSSQTDNSRGSTAITIGHDGPSEPIGSDAEPNPFPNSATQTGTSPSPISESDFEGTLPDTTNLPTYTTAGNASISSRCTSSSGKDLQYCLLETVGGKIEAGSSISLGDYITSAFNWLLTLLAVLAIVMLIIYGIGYTTAGVSEAGKTSMKNHLSGVMWGVGIALGAWLLLEFINPQINRSTFDPFKALLSSGAGGRAVDDSAGLSFDSVGTRGEPSVNDERFVTQNAFFSSPQIGRVNFFGGGGDAIGIAKIKQGDPSGLAFVQRRDQLPENYWSGHGGTLFASLNTEAFYFAAPVTGSVTPGTKFIVSNLETGKSAVAILVDRGPNIQREGLLDVSNGLGRAVGFSGGGNNHFSVEIAPDQKLPPGAIMQ